MLALGVTLPSWISCPEEQQEAFHAGPAGRIAEHAAVQSFAAMTILK
jgi:hypothetical protein